MTDVQHFCFGLSVKETMLFANEERQQLSLTLRKHAHVIFKTIDRSIVQ